MKRLFFRLIGRHSDGSKHEWATWRDIGSHRCEWDYCHCYIKHCSDCDTTVTVSDGTMEVR